MCCEQVVKVAFSEFPHMERLESIRCGKRWVSESAGESWFPKGRSTQKVSEHEREKQRKIFHVKFKVNRDRRRLIYTS